MGAERALALASALAVCACGSDDGDGGSGGSPGFGGGGGQAGSSGGMAGMGMGGSMAGSGGSAMGGSAGMGAAGVGGGAGSAGAAGMGGSGGMSMAQELIDALGMSTWHGTQMRDGRSRAIEYQFDAPSQLWAEIRNPYGPSRLREMRAMVFDADGMSVETTVTSPGGWPIHPENGRKDDWTIEVIDGTPRKLRTTRGGVMEEFDEGPWPVPQTGLTAFVNVFTDGPVNTAFCTSGISGFDHQTIWDFARDMSTEPSLGTDVVAGVPLDTWTDASGNNQFAVQNVPGFDQHGGTDLTDQFNFVVRYFGTVTHTGGTIGMRERNDDVEDVVWTFLGGDVGSNDPDDLFLEVHGFLFPDATPPEPSATFAGGDVTLEAILVRCNQEIRDVDVEIELNGGGWQLVGSAPTKPEINTTLFPTALF